MYLDDRKIVHSLLSKPLTKRFFRGCLHILSFLHDVSTEIEVFPNKMKITPTIQLAFKTLGYRTVLVCVWVFSSPKYYKMAATDSSRYKIFSQAAIHLEYSFGRKEFLSDF